MEALSMVRSTVPLPFSDAQHALCLELGKLVKAGLTVPNSSTSSNSFAGAAAATVAGSGEDGGCEAMVAAGGSDCAGGIGSDGGRVCGDGMGRKKFGFVYARTRSKKYFSRVSGVAEHRVSPPRPAHAPPRRHKRRRTQAHHVSTSETSPLPSPAPFEPAARRQPREEIEESCVEYSQTHDTHKYIPQKLMPEAVSIVARKGCLLSLTDKPCAGCMAVVNEMQHQLPQGNKKSKASEEDYTWANIQQELIWAEITKQASELQGSESKDIGPERLVDWDSNWSSIPDFK